MTTRTVKNVVLGAGAMGSAAAYQLARRGEPVVLVEQFGLGHDRGSSHGAARITRRVTVNPELVRKAPRGPYCEFVWDRIRDLWCSSFRK